MAFSTKNFSPHFFGAPPKIFPSFDPGRCRFLGSRSGLFYQKFFGGNFRRTFHLIAPPQHTFFFFFNWPPGCSPRPMYIAAELVPIFHPRSSIIHPAYCPRRYFFLFFPWTISYANRNFASGQDLIPLSRSAVSQAIARPRGCFFFRKHCFA